MPEQQIATDSVSASVSNVPVPYQARAIALGFVHITDSRMRSGSGGSYAFVRRPTNQDQIGRFNYNLMTQRAGFVGFDGLTWMKFGTVTKADLDFMRECCPGGGGSQVLGLYGEEFSRAELAARRKDPFCKLPLPRAEA